MEYINPIFNNISDKKGKQFIESPSTKPTRTRAVRSDKGHNIKFPIDPILQIKLKTYCKQATRAFESKGKEPITQTKFNTALLRFGLNNQAILKWDFEYKDSKNYMHTQILKTEYENVIGGPHGISVRKALSDRKVVYQIIQSVISWLEGNGELEKII